MDMFFQDPSEVPLPPQLVRIRELSATPWPDGRRVRVYLEVDPFQKRPNADVEILGAEGQVFAEISIIETATRKMEFNMHLRQPETAGDYALKVVLFYEDGPVLAEASSEISPPNAEAPNDEAEPRQVVDERSVRFTIA